MIKSEKICLAINIILAVVISVVFGIVLYFIIDYLIYGGYYTGLGVPLLAMGIFGGIFAVLFAIGTLIKFFVKRRAPACEKTQAGGIKAQTVRVVNKISTIVFFAALALIVVCFCVVGYLAYAEIFEAYSVLPSLASILIIFYVSLRMIIAKKREPLGAGYEETKQKHVLVKVGCLVTAVILSGVGCIYSFQNSFLFTPAGDYEYSHYSYDDVFSDFERIEGDDYHLLTTGDYTVCLYAPYAESAPTLIYFGDTVENKMFGDRSVKASGGFFLDMSRGDNGWGIFEGYNVLSINNPGVTGSKGFSNKNSIFKMILEVYDSLGEIDLISTDKVVVAGDRIGTGFATYLASQREVDGLALINPFYDGADLINAYTNMFYGPMRLLVSNKIETGEYAKDVSVPPLIVESTQTKFSRGGEVADCFSSVYEYKKLDFYRIGAYTSPDDEVYSIIKDYLQVIAGR